MEIIQLLRERAKKKNNTTIVLPEGNDLRILQAAAFISIEKIAKIVLIGHSDEIEKKLRSHNADLSNIEIVDIEKSPLTDGYIDAFYELRKHKGITKDDVKKTIMENSIYFGALMVKNGLADGLVAGAVNTTRDIARAVLWCIGVDKSIKTMSSSFIMILPDESFGANGVLVFADCGIVPDPNPRQLANIAISSSELINILFEAQPKIAMLSFSTKGSGHSLKTEKIIKAIEIVKEKKPDLLIDGELQADAALVPEAAKIKAPKSPIGGDANVLIFPNLEAGNISYKLTQRLAKARALGPLLHGLLAPCSDLSRACSWEDVVDIVSVTVLRHAYSKK